MNIGIVTTWFERGAAYVSRAYMEVLQRQGFSIFIYARGGEQYAKGNTVWDLPNVTWSPRYHGVIKGSANYIDPSHLLKWVSGNKIKIVIFNEERTFRNVDWLNNCGIVTGAYIDYYTKETVDLFAKYDFLLCNTQRHYSVFKHFENAIYLQWGTNIDMFHPQLSLHDQVNYVKFFHSAGWNNRRGLDLLLKAFKIVKGDCRLIIHCQIPLNQFPSEIQKDIESDERIAVINETVSAPGLYHLGDVYVYPSRLDGIGLTVAEALSCGLPVVTTDCPPMNEFIFDGINGRTVKIERYYTRKNKYFWPVAEVDIYDLAMKMQEFVDSPEEIIRYKIDARKSAEEKFDWFLNAANLGGDLVKIYDQKYSKPCCNKYLGNIKNVYWKCESSFMAVQHYTTLPLLKWIKSIIKTNKQPR
ncbi:glycosyltransferase family 4 protein [Planctomycetota bacterium]